MLDDVGGLEDSIVDPLGVVHNVCDVGKGYTATARLAVMAQFAHARRALRGVTESN